MQIKVTFKKIDPSSSLKSYVTKKLEKFDLASEAVMAALADGGVTMADMQVLAAGNLMGSGGIGQQIQKQVGQTGIPVYNVSNACATGCIGHHDSWKKPVLAMTPSVI